MTAVGLVHEFAALADCAIQLESVSVTTGGGLLDVPAASAAAVLELSIDGPGSTGPGEFRLVALAAGPRVTALAFSSTGFGAVDPAEIDLVVGIAAAKLAG